METSGNGQYLMDVILRFFQEDHWNYQKLIDQPVYRAGFRGERGTWVCYARVDEGNQRFLFYSLMGLNIPPLYRPNVLEYLSRVNFRLPIGNFDMDPNSGEIRFKIGVETPKSELSVDMVRSIANTTVRAMDYYFPGVVAVVHSGLSPEAALARVESQPEGSFSS